MSYKAVRLEGEAMQTILPLLPAGIRVLLAGIPPSIADQIQEIRVREGRPLEIIWSGGYSFVQQDGKLTLQPETAYCTTRKDAAALLEALTQHSLYSYEEELKQGFITTAGGHRVGLAGRTLIERGMVKSVRDVAGFNIRLAKEHRNAAAGLLPKLICRERGELVHTLIVSPPCQGKTTMIRDLSRLLSTGYTAAAGIRRSYKVGIVDERSEIAACVKGVPAFDVGPRTDVLDHCPKAAGMMMMIRSLSPEVLVVDEIGRAEDAAAVHEAVHAGIIVIATAHGSDKEDIRRRPVLKELLQEQVFERIVVLRRERSRLATGTSASSGGAIAASVYDGAGHRLEERILCSS